MSRLAVHGGPAAFPEGPPGWPPPDAELAEILARLGSDGGWARYQGPHGEQLAEALRELLGVAHVRLCCSGTFAVELALRALQLGPGDEVLLAGYDFSGNFRAIEAVGASPVLVDLEPDSWRMDLRLLPEACSPRTRAVLVSHLHGTLADMPQLRRFADERGLSLIEDACQVPGAWVAGRRAGTWGDAGVFSFGGSKLLSAGRGGALVTPHASVHQRAKVYCERGNDAYPLSELQAAVLLPQLRKLDQRQEVRHHHVLRLVEACGELPGWHWRLNQVPDSLPAYYKVGIRYRSSELHGIGRDMLVATLQAEGVAIDAGFLGFVRRSARRCRRVNELPFSAQAAEHTLLLHHPVLLAPREVIDRLAAALTKVVMALAEEERKR